MSKRRPRNENGQRQYNVSSLEKAFALLDLFTAEEAALSVSELAKRLHTRASTIYPTLRTLQKHGYLQQDEQKRYRLGLKFLEKGRIILDQLDIRTVAQPHLRRLAEACQANAHLAVLHEGRVIYLHREEGHPSLTIQDIIGYSAPAHCTALGKVLLAHLDPGALEAFLEAYELRPLTPNTITDREQLKDELVRVRAQGYAVDNEEFHEGVVCVAAPVHDYRDRVAAAISISLPRSRFADQAARMACVRRVQDAARSISEEMGFRPIH